MKVRLLHPDRDAELHPPLRDGDEDLVADLDLQPVLDVMVADRQLSDIPHTLLRPLTDPREIRWRQRVAADAIADPEAMRGLFDLAGRALDSQRGSWLYSARTADSLLSSSLFTLRAVIPSMRELSRFARRQLPTATSPGLSALYGRLVQELDATYLDEVDAMLSQLRFPGGMVARAVVTQEAMVGSLELLAPRTGRRTWRETLGVGTQGRFRFTLAERDDAGARALSDLRDDALFDVATVLAEAAHHVKSFFRQLQWETGFYVGCVQLQQRLDRAGVQRCWPEPLASTDGTLETTGLANVSLPLRQGSPAVPNDLSGDAARLVIITGANQGGKTTLLRSIGCAHLFMQSGVFVAAATYSSELAPAVHTHFRRAEEDSLRSGKLDEELGRMSSIVDRCRPGDLVLMNESFASTDEIEGSYIGGEIIDALLRHGMRVLVVTHFHALARRYLGRAETLFLRAERLPDGGRSYRVLPDRPQATSHGFDVYRAVFGDQPSGGLAVAADGSPPMETSAQQSRSPHDDVGVTVCDDDSTEDPVPFVSP